MSFVVPIPAKLFKYSVFLAILLFLGVFCNSVYYYSVKDQDEITEMRYQSSTQSGWECESIGTFNNPVQLLSMDNMIPSNISQSISTNWISFKNYTAKYIDTSPGGYAGSYDHIVSTKINNNHFDFMQMTSFYKGAVKDSIFNVIGNAKTVNDCIETISNYSCSASSVKSSQMLRDLDVYIFRVDLDIDWKWIDSNSTDDVDLFGLMLYKQGTKSIFNDSLGGWGKIKGTSFFAMDFTNPQHTEYRVLTKSEQNANLCQDIEAVVQNEGYFWGINMLYGTKFQLAHSSKETWYYPQQYAGSNFPEVNSVNLNVKCEKMEHDYCVVNGTDQFEITTSRGTVLDKQRYDDQRSNMYYGMYLLLSDEFGESCSERWQTVCTEYYDINGLCEKMYVSPYSCTKKERKGYIDIVWLSFISAQSVFTTFMVLFGCYAAVSLKDTVADTEGVETNGKTTTN